MSQPNEHHHLPTAPSPAKLLAFLRELEENAERIKRDYPVFWPSGYETAKRGGLERTRRSVGGVSGDVGNTVIGVERVRRHLDLSADQVLKAVGYLRGASVELTRAANAIDGQARHEVDTTPAVGTEQDGFNADGTPKPDWQRPMTPEQARDFQERREARAAGLWYIAQCQECALRMPFRSERQRDAWAKEHRLTNGPLTGEKHEVATLEERVSTVPWASEEVHG